MILISKAKVPSDKGELWLRELRKGAAARGFIPAPPVPLNSGRNNSQEHSLKSPLSIAGHGSKNKTKQKERGKKEN